MCTVTVGGQTLLAIGGGDDWTVRLWDPRARICRATIPTHHPVRGMAAVGDSLAIALSAGILVIKLNAAA
jgi:hypothetical protein